jgi:hypothetical protein
LEAACGPHNGVDELGYSSTLTAETMQCFSNTPGPKREQSNCNSCKVIFADDLDLSIPVNSGFLRTMSTSANAMSCHAKNKGSMSWFPTGLICILTNQPLVLKPKLGMSDHRRQSIAVYPMTYFDPANPEYDAANPNHARINSDVRDRVADYLPEFFLWVRALAGVSKDRPTRSSFLTPRPPEVREESVLANPLATLGGHKSDSDFTKEFITANLRKADQATNSLSGEKCSSAAEVQEVQEALQAFLAVKGRVTMKADAKRLLDSKLVYVGTVTKVAGSSVSAFYKLSAEKGLKSAAKLI